MFYVYNSLSDLLGRFRQQQRNLMPTELWACLPLFLFAKCSEPYTHRHSRDMSPMLCQIRRLSSTGGDSTKNGRSRDIDFLFFIHVKRSKTHMYTSCVSLISLTDTPWTVVLLHCYISILGIHVLKNRNNTTYCRINFLFY
jgi:hypothetical protein